MRADTDRPPYESIWMHLMDAPLRQNWIDAGGIRTRYAEIGERGKPVLIMLHGTGGSWEAFCANLSAHGEHFHCFALDLVGSGLSAHPDYDYEIPVYVRHVHDFMDAVGVEKSAFIGVSLGSWIAARFALTHPGRTTSLTLLSAAGLMATASNMRQVRSLRSNAVENPSWDNIKPVFDNLIHDESKRIDDFVGLRQKIYRQPGMVQTMQHVLCLQNLETRQRNLLTEEEWRSITAPALVIGSAQDQGEYLDTARHVADVMPHAQYREMQGVAHWPQFEDPDTFNRHSIAFLKQYAAA